MFVNGPYRTEENRGGNYRNPGLPSVDPGYRNGPFRAED
jgi:hypothetical protein